MGQCIVSRFGSLLVSAILGITLLIAHSTRGTFLQPIAKEVPLEELPLTLGEWHGEESSALGVRSQQILQLDRYLRRIYTNENGDQVFLYVGYWRRQTGEHQAAKHSPAVCLPANGWRVTDRREKRVTVAEAEPSLELNSLVGEFAHEHALFYYWFFSGDETYHDEWLALVKIALQTFIHKRSDGGIVELSVELKDRSELNLEPHHQTLESFIREFYPALRKLL